MAFAIGCNSLLARWRVSCDRIRVFPTSYAFKRSPPNEVARERLRHVFLSSRCYLSQRERSPGAHKNRDAIKMSTSSIVFSGIAPHPPIMVPEVGREAVAEVRGSIDAMREFTRRIIQSRAETIVLVSPHAPLEARAFVAYHDAQLYGDFANFRAPEAVVEAPLDEELLTEIARTASEQGYEVLGIKGYYLDHGTAVPLYFLLRNGWRGSLVALGYSFLSNEDHLRFGTCIERATRSV